MTDLGLETMDVAMSPSIVLYFDCATGTPRKKELFSFTLLVFRVKMQKSMILNKKKGGTWSI